MHTWMAKPQPNGTDTRELQRLDAERYGWTKQPATTPVSLCEGAIDVYAGSSPTSNTHMSMGEQTRPATEDEISAAWAQTLHPYLATWNDGYHAISNYLDEFWAWNTIHAHQGSRGCSSGHVVMKDRQYPRHTVYITVYDPVGTAQGIYHEYAHLRLETLGIHIETHDRKLLLNDPTELYDSSVRFDIKRPMSAVLHGVYAWLMFTENDWQLYHAGVTTHELFTTYTKHNVPKIRNGIREIQQHGRFTDAGWEFIEGVYGWADDLCLRCETAYI